MKKIYILGTAVLALGAASALAQTYAPPGAAPSYTPPGAPTAPGYPPQAGYQAAPYPPSQYPPVQGYVAPAPAPVTYCQPYSDKFTMGSEVRVVHGSACMHPDGSWELHPTDSGMRYVTRGNGLYLIPSQPFTVVIGDDHHHHHDHHY